MKLSCIHRGRLPFWWSVACLNFKYNNFLLHSPKILLPLLAKKGMFIHFVCEFRTHLFSPHISDSFVFPMGFLHRNYVTTILASFVICYFEYVKASTDFNMNYLVFHNMGITPSGIFGCLGNLPNAIQGSWEYPGCLASRKALKTVFR